ncbi:MAG: hypothetical protein HY746_04525 [Elusimicrobia bacterium]|nr:hypothetical protein [Elusimicrobiota bacterium]
MIKIFFYISLILPNFSFTLASDNLDIDSVTSERISANRASLPAENSPDANPQENLKEWTIMVYINGKSNIEPFAVRDMNRLETAGSSGKINIVAELGRSKGLENDTQVDGDWSGTRRYFVSKDSDMNRISSPALMEFQKADMGDWRHAAGFVKWAKENFPAKKYLLIIWDHGWGWIDPEQPGENLLDDSKASKRKSISHDFETGNYIKTAELSMLFKEAGKIDVYASMACFMQMAEVAYEIRDYADVIVGSEEVIQLPSFNFEDFLRLMTEKPQSSPADAAVLLVDTFKEMYSRPEYLDELERTKYGTQLSAVKAVMLAELAGKVKAWADIAQKINDTNALGKAKKDVLRFEVGDETTDPKKEISFYGDLYHFVEITVANLNPALDGSKELAALGEDLKQFIASALVIKNVYLGKDRTGKTYSNTHGIGIHIPGKPGNLIEYHDTYHKLAFAKDSGWRKFIKYLEKIE